MLSPKGKGQEKAYYLSPGEKDKGKFTIRAQVKGTGEIL